MTWFLLLNPNTSRPARPKALPNRPKVQRKAPHRLLETSIYSEMSSTLRKYTALLADELERSMGFGVCGAICYGLFIRWALCFTGITINNVTACILTALHSHSSSVLAYSPPPGATDNAAVAVRTCRLISRTTRSEKRLF